jgi:hypothetical protein
MSSEDVMADVSKDELELWSGARRPEGAANKEAKASYARRDEIIVDIARAITETYPQTIRHIYYVCSGLKLVGKDHGKEAYWYSIVGDVIGKARWNAGNPGGLDWARIADDSRPFEKPTFWDDAATFLSSVVPQFALDKWRGQERRVIVCTEKTAIMGMLSDYCEKWHIPLMSFHGQASDGGGIYELAKYIVGLPIPKTLPVPETTEHAYLSGLIVRCFYFGDFDPAGASIDRSVFGDEQAEEKYSHARLGRLNRLVWKMLKCKNVPVIRYERIGITAEDVCNPEYAPYLLEVNMNDVNFARYKEDSNKIEGFPELECFTTEKKSRGMQPATLGIDALSAEELIGRMDSWVRAILDVDNNAEWQQQAEEFQTQQSKLAELTHE